MWEREKWERTLRFTLDCCCPKPKGWGLRKSLHPQHGLSLRSSWWAVALITVQRHWLLAPEGDCMDLGLLLLMPQVSRQVVPPSWNSVPLLMTEIPTPVSYDMGKGSIEAQTVDYQMEEAVGADDQRGNCSWCDDRDTGRLFCGRCHPLVTPKEGLGTRHFWGKGFCLLRVEVGVGVDRDWQPQNRSAQDCIISNLDGDCE